MLKLQSDKTKSLATLIKDMDTVFSLFIRLRDADESGTVTCFVTGERVFWKDSDAAHFWGRGRMGTRWDEMNVHASSIASNRFDYNHDVEYAEKMAGNYSPTELGMLNVRAHSMMKFTRPELQEMIEEYTLKVANLRKLKGI